MNELWAEFLGSPVFIATSIAYFLVESVATFDKRILQAKWAGDLPSQQSELPTWTHGIHILNWVLLVAIFVMSWKLAIVIWILCFTLKVLPVMETIGSILVSPFWSPDQQEIDQKLDDHVEHNDQAEASPDANKKSLEEGRVDIANLLTKIRIKFGVSFVLAVVTLCLVLFFGLNKWLLTVPGLLGIATIIYLMNIIIFSVDWEPKAVGGSKEVSDESRLRSFEKYFDAVFKFIDADAGSLEEQIGELGNLVDSAKKLREKGIEVPASYFEVMESMSELIRLRQEVRKKELEDALKESTDFDCSPTYQESGGLADQKASESEADLRSSKITQSSEIENKWNEGYTAFQRGQDLYFKKDIEEALSCFDSAIKLGFEEAEIYGLRGGCLQSLKFDLDAIDDFSKAIEFDPEDSNNYFMRSISKGSVGDLKGRVDDLNKAIQLAGIDSASTRSHNAYARELGYKDGVAGMYQLQLMFAQLDLKRQANDEKRTQASGDKLGPDLATQRRSQARRRARGGSGSSDGCREAMEPAPKKTKEQTEYQQTGLESKD